MKNKVFTPEELFSARLLRWRCRTDLEFLAREILGYKDIDRSVHGPVLDVLQKFPYPKNKEEFEENDVWNGKTWRYKPLRDMQSLSGDRRVLILDPRGHLKTTINAQSHTIQWILNYPDAAIAIFQSNLEKAELILGEIRRHFQFNERLRQIFPEFCPQKLNDFGTKGAFTVPARASSVTRREPTLMALSIEKGLAGLHFDVMKFSDIVEPENVKTDDRIADVKAAFYMAENLLVSPVFWIDVEGTRYHHGDLYGELVDKWMRELKERLPHKYRIHVRGCFKKRMEPGEEYTPDKLARPNLLRPDKTPIPIWEFDAKGHPRFPLTHLLELQRNDGYIFSCSRGDQKILMADWSEREIKDVRAGDLVVGFKTVGKKMRLVPSLVKSVGSNARQMLYEITTASGRKTYQTADHKWYVGKNDVYREVGVGSSLFSAYRPFDRTQQYSWLGGFFDGEGSIHGRYGLTVYQKHEKLRQRFEKEAAEAGFDFPAHIDDRRGVWAYSLRGGRSEALRFAWCTNSEKARGLFDALWGAQACEHQGEEKIVSMIPAGEDQTYFLETETGNYIVSGFLSSNCQQLNQPSGAGGDVAFPQDKIISRNTISPKHFRENVRVHHYEVTIDTAETINARSNYTAIAVSAWDSAGRCYIVELVHEKLLPKALVDKIFALNAKYRPTRIAIEETGFVRGLHAAIERTSEMLGVYLPLEFLKRDNREAKTERIVKTLQPWYISGDLRFVVDFEKEPAWWEALCKELREFPVGTTDDILDALADQFQGKDYFGRLQGRPSHEASHNVELERFLGITDPFSEDAQDEPRLAENDPFMCTGYL